MLAEVERAPSAEGPSCRRLETDVSAVAIPAPGVSLRLPRRRTSAEPQQRESGLGAASDRAVFSWKWADKRYCATGSNLCSPPRGELRGIHHVLEQTFSLASRRGSAADADAPNLEAFIGCASAAGRGDWSGAINLWQPERGVGLLRAIAFSSIASAAWPHA
jgi:hypothetical protein